MSMNRKKPRQTAYEIAVKLYSEDARMTNLRIDREFIRENNAIAARWAQEKRAKIAKAMAEEALEQEMLNA